MRRADIDDAVHRMPKVELHVHLEGATDAETVWEMAQRNGVSLPADSLDSWREMYQFRDFHHFIEIYDYCTQTMKTPEDWELMVGRFAEHQAEQNVVSSEVFLSSSHVLTHLPADEWTGALVAGASAAEDRHGIRIRFIPDIGRQMPDSQQAVLDCVLGGMASGYFIGLGLGGVEEGFPPHLFEETYRQAREAGLRVVAHAGETTGAETIRDSVDLLQAERIGHGIRVLDDPALVARLRSEQVPFEVCPTSNYCLGVVGKGEPHPLRQMVDAGLLCTVNSDDPPMFCTTLVDEYRLLARQGFDWEELVQLNLNAVSASFLSAEEKAELREEVQAFVESAK